MIVRLADPNIRINIMKVTQSYIALIVISMFILLLAACSQGSSFSPEPRAPVDEESINSPDPIEDKKKTGEYNITLQFVDQTITPSQKKIFLDAASIWQKVITTDLKDVETNVPAGACGDADPGFSGVIDDIVIIISVPNIDGPGKVLGTSGPCGLRGSAPDHHLPFYGQMSFDTADVTRYEELGGLKDLILHEMGHVLGVGTLWKLFEVISGTGTNNPNFTGKNALAEWHALGGKGTLPIENEGGIGTRDMHWRESIFDAELMTSYNDTSQSLSRLTIASLKDLNYNNVDFSMADSSYTLPSAQNIQTLSDNNIDLHSVPTTVRFYE